MTFRVSPPPLSFFERIQASLAWIFLAPFLLTLVSILSNYREAVITVHPAQIFRPLLVLWALQLILIPVFLKLIGNKFWASLALSVFTLAFYFSPGMFTAAITLIGAAFAIWVGVAAFMAARTQKKYRLSLPPLFALMNLISFGLVLNFLFQLSPLVTRMDWAGYQASRQQVRNTLAGANPSASKRPDIYFIVLDAYARADVLETYYQYDNSAFLAGLQSKGFFIPSAAYSNYPKTAISISSTLNAQYLTETVPSLRGSLAWWLAEPFLRENAVKTALKNMGYETISIATDWDITNDTAVDSYLAPPRLRLSSFENFILAKTPLRVISPALKSVTLGESYASHRELILNNFTSLAAIPENPAPTFVFAHIIAPHPPFVFDASGNPLTPSYPFAFKDATDFPDGLEAYRTGYIDQLQYVNTRLLETIETILARSPEPPIIILQADHGPALHVDFSSLENTCVKERFAIFAAYYLPGLPQNPIPNDITPVNLYRILFNSYFETNLPLLENSSYYYNGTVTIFDTQDVTSRLSLDCSPQP